MPFTCRFRQVPPSIIENATGLALLAQGAVPGDNGRGERASYLPRRDKCLGEPRGRSRTSLKRNPLYRAPDSNSGNRRKRVDERLISKSLEPVSFRSRESSRITLRQQHERQGKSVPVLRLAVFALDWFALRAFAPLVQWSGAFPYVAFGARGCEIRLVAGSASRERFYVVDDGTQFIQQRSAVARPVRMIKERGFTWPDWRNSRSISFITGLKITGRLHHRQIHLSRRNTRSCKSFGSAGRDLSKLHSTIKKDSTGIPKSSAASSQRR